MKLTTENSASSLGAPVFVDEHGNAVGYADGLKKLRQEKGWSVADLAEQVGASKRTVEGWEQGRTPSKAALILLMRTI